MGFWQVYMGIYGGGPAVAVSVDYVTTRLTLTGTSQQRYAIAGQSEERYVIIGASQP